MERRGWLTAPRVQQVPQRVRAAAVAAQLARVDHELEREVRAEEAQQLEQIVGRELLVRAQAPEAVLDDEHERPPVVRACRDVGKVAKQHVRAVEHLGKIVGDEVERGGRPEAEQQRDHVVQVQRDVVCVQVLLRVQSPLARVLAPRRLHSRRGP